MSKTKKSIEKDGERYITVPQAAELTNKHAMTIRNWIRKGIIESFQVEKTRRSPHYIRVLSIPKYLYDADTLRQIINSDSA